MMEQRLRPEEAVKANVRSVERVSAHFVAGIGVAGPEDYWPRYGDSGMFRAPTGAVGS